MADIQAIIRKIKKGTEQEANLSYFANHMMSVGHQLSYIRFSLNFISYWEVFHDAVEEGEEVFGTLLRLTGQLNEVVGDWLNETSCGESMEQGIHTIHALRENSMNCMKVLTAYADHFLIYEYMLNRIEYRFRPDGLPKNYSDEWFKEEILAYITGESDTSLQQYLTVSVLEQLPMRMHKERFFQIVKEGLDAYTGSAKDTVDDLLHMIRTSALLEDPASTDEDWGELAAVLNYLKQIEWKTITEGQYDQAILQLQTGMKLLNQNMNLFAMFHELINDMYVMQLSRPYALMDLQRQKTQDYLIEKVYHSFVDPETPLDIDELFDLLDSQVGIQEQYDAQFRVGEAALYDIMDNHKTLIAGLMLEKEYNIIKRMASLLSSSHYIDLEQDDHAQSVTSKEDMMQIAAGLIEELKTTFARIPRMQIRAVMSRILTMLPLHVRTYDALEQYISESLAACTDTAEKAACVEIIHSLITDDWDMSETEV